MKKIYSVLLLLALICTALCSCFEPDEPPTNPSYGSLSEGELPTYEGKAYAIINNNVPEFTDEEKSVTKSYEFYSELDELGRCGYTMACIGRDLMPTESRGDINEVYPSGWKNSSGKSNNTEYEFVDAGWLYNRCHLIGFQLTGENANEKNLITGTRYLNIEGMLTFENRIADYVKETGNHVIYRVTPIFVGYELVARGVHLEAYSVEDEGEEICFNVYSFNVQPGVVINYKTGENRLALPDEVVGGHIHTDTNDDLKCDDCDEPFNDGCDVHRDADDNGKCDKTDCGVAFSDACEPHVDANDDGKCEKCEEAYDDGAEIKTYVLNKSSKVVHTEAHGTMKEENKLVFTGTLEELLATYTDYRPCGTCNPYGWYAGN